MRVATSVTVAAALVLGGIVVSADAAAPATPTWSVVPSPNRTARVGASAGAILGGVACRTITSCVVVGNFTTIILYHSPVIPATRRGRSPRRHGRERPRKRPATCRRSRASLVIVASVSATSTVERVPTH